MRFFQLFLILLSFFSANAQAATEDDIAAHLAEMEAFMTMKPNPDVTKNGIGIYVYDGMFAMDALNPYQVFKSAGLKVFLIGQKKGSVITSSQLKN
jgi:hypothetical protein